MEAGEIFRSRLLPGERIKWAGRPKQGFLLTDRDMILVPSSIFFLGFSLFWTSLASNEGGAPWFFGFVGYLFIATGAYFFAGRFAVDAWLRRDLVYAVTDRRILIARPTPFSRFTALPLAQLPVIDLKEHADGRGTIRFGPRAPVWSNQQVANWTPTLDPQPQFLSIEGPRQVFDLIQRAASE